MRATGSLGSAAFVSLVVSQTDPAPDSNRCDEWYHTSCMGMKDEQAELVDMFVCPHCEPRECLPDEDNVKEARFAYPLL